MYLTLIFIFLIGMLTKFADLVADDGLKIRRTYSYPIGFMYGILAAYVAIAEPLLAPIVIATVIAVLITNKIDKSPHNIGIASVFLFLTVWGFPSVNLLLMAIFLATEVVGEIGNDLADKRKMNGILKKTFDYRLISDIAALIVSFLTGWWIIFFGMIIFDAGYIPVGEAGKRLLPASRAGK